MISEFILLHTTINHNQRLEIKSIRIEVNVNALAYKLHVIFHDSLFNNISLVLVRDVKAVS